MSKQVTHHSAEERAAKARADSSMHSANATKAAIRRRRLLESIPLGLIYVFLVCMTIFALFPIYYVIQASLGGSQNLYTTDLHILPINPTFDNYVYAFTQQPMLAWLVNTVFVCGLSTLIGVIFAMTSAYALARFRFRGRQLSLNLLLAIQAFPALLAITAYYYLLQYLNLLNTAPDRKSTR